MQDQNRDDIKRLMAHYDAACEEPAPVRNQSAPHPSANGSGKKKSKSNPTTIKTEKAPPNPPSKLIFGQELRDVTDFDPAQIPPEFRSNPQDVFVDSLVIERVSDIKPLPVEWLWPGRVPLGKLTLLAGDPGICKSLVALDMAARLSRGAAWPDDPTKPQPPASAIVFSMEDDLQDTIVPRLLRSGVDGDRAFVVDGVHNRPPYVDLQWKRPFRIPDELPSLEKAIQELWPVRLIVFDPLTAYCGKGDGRARSGVHSMLDPLNALARKYGVAILGTTHLKNGDSNKAIYRAALDTAFTTAARSVWAIVYDGDHPKRRLMVQTKMNLAAEIEGLALEIGPDGRIVWDVEPVDIAADRALARERYGKRKWEAMDFLQTVLADGPLLSSELLRLAREAGISTTTLNRARHALGVIWDQEGYGPRGEFTVSLKSPTTRILMDSLA